MRDYFRKTYLVDKSYERQSSFMRARPQTNVKLITTDRSQVNYSRTPQATLRKPYQHDTYNEMPYLFSGYPAVRRNWFDSRVGGQGEAVTDDVSFSPHPFDTSIGFLSGVSGDAWATARNAVNGGQGEGIGLTYSRVGAYRTDPLGSHAGIDRFFLGFDLANMPREEIKSVSLKLTLAFDPADSTGESICLQASIHNPTDLASKNNAVYSSCYEPVLATAKFQSNVTNLVFNNFGKRYIRSKLGTWASFCLREYDHDYLNVDVDPSASFYMYFYTADHPIKEVRPTLIIKY